MPYTLDQYKSILKSISNTELQQEEEYVKDIIKDLENQLSNMRDKEIAIHLEKSDRGWYIEAHEKWLKKYKDELDKGDK